MAKTTLYRVVVKKHQQKNRCYTFPIGTLLYDKDSAINIAQETARSMVTRSGFDKHEGKYRIVTYPAASLAIADYYNYRADIFIDNEWRSTIAVYPVNIEDNYYEYRTMDIHKFSNQFVISIAMTDIAVLDSLNEALMFIDWFILN